MSVPVRSPWPSSRIAPSARSRWRAKRPSSSAPAAGYGSAPLGTSRPPPPEMHRRRWDGRACGASTSGIGEMSHPTRSSSDAAMTWVVAHRGGSERFAGNSLDAFADAVAAGVDMIEFDVRRTADGALVVAHDDTVGDRRLAELDGAVTLERLFELTAGRVRLDVELKERGCAQEALDLALA